ncbi:hypothetical protein NHH03_14745 [Stieleria sp. TO1_6]|uniref:hypothetical protein n=1 Tax=Stieleria tagensis TaxID=2956795 RepID=UPI00209AE33B|nr:hypothetical protein [Stieleria tagensis]MCO8123004.1 hypothetical protein [Stieleria tagensis]
MTDSQVPDPTTEPTTDSTRVGDTPSAASHRPWRAPLIAAVALAALAVVLNWPLAYVETATIGDVELFPDFKLSQTPLPVMAGWPFRYSIRYQESGTSPGLSVFSIGALLRNVTVALLAIGLVCFYVYRRGKSTVVADRKKLRISIGDLLVLTILIALPFGMWQSLKRGNQHTGQLVREFAKSDTAVRRSTWVPAILQPRLPTSVLEMLRRIRVVRLENPSDALVQSAVQIPTLTGLRIGGGDYDLASLAPLGNSIHLTDLRLAGRELDESTLQWITSKRRLHTVNLMRTNLTTEAARALGTLPDLRHLNLIHTEVQLADLGKPDWSDTIETLELPHPERGEHDQIEIDGWPNLRHLVINEYDTPVNSATMKVRLANLPRLETLTLDQFQKFDLELDELPKLKSVKNELSHWDARLPHGGSVPGQNWLERFAGSGLPNLQELSFFCVDLKSFSLQGPTKIETMGAGVYYRSLNRSRINNPYERELSPEAATALIEGIGNSTGPAVIDLDAVPLAGVDLSPLAKNKQLTHLLLAASGTEWKQWKSLESMKWLRQLRLTNNPVNETVVRWIIGAFPNLETLEYGQDTTSGRYRSNSVFMTGSMDSVAIEYVGHDNLTTILRHDGDFSYVESIKIVDMPKLEMSVEADWVESLKIQNAPRLTGIAINGPLPADAQISEQNNLAFFAVGGPTVSDAIVEPILGSTRIGVLTLAYPVVSAELLAKLPVGGTHALSLPGCEVDDAVVEQWPKLPLLTHLNLANTQITAASLPKLLDSQNLSSLVLDHCPIDADSLAAIGSQFSLQHLSVAGIGIPRTILAKLLQETELNTLNLSDTDLSDDLLKLIADKGSKLRHLTLRNVTFNDESLAKALSSHRQLNVDLTDSPIATQLQIKLLNEHRLRSLADWQQRMHLQAISQQQQMGYTMTPGVFTDFKPPSLVVVEDFAPGGQYSADVIRAMGTGPNAMMTIGGGNPTNITITPPTSSTPTAVQFGRWIGRLYSGNVNPADPVNDTVDAAAIDSEADGDDQ